jgi:dihydropteroate synthase
MNMRLITPKYLERELKSIGVSLTGLDKMLPKAEVQLIKIYSLPISTAFILKQEFLSVGGDAALPKDALELKKKKVDCVLIGTKKAYLKLIPKLQENHYKTKEIADKLDELLKINLTKERIFKCGKFSFNLGKKTYIMGVLNLTPDSFWEASRYNSPTSALLKVEEMVKEGVDIVDIGGESTRPGSTPCSVEEELERILPTLKLLNKEFPDLPVSVDTYKPPVAKAAIEYSAAIINDISGLHFSTNLAWRREVKGYEEKFGGYPPLEEVIKDSGVGLILMHILNRPKVMQKNPKYKDLMQEVTEYLRSAIDKATKAGIDKNRLIIDPGIGFGKTVEDNIELIKRISELRSLGIPLLLGTSRKSFIGALLGKRKEVLPPQQRLFGTLATLVIAIKEGIDIVRVHDVKEAKELICVVDELCR